MKSYTKKYKVFFNVLIVTLTVLFFPVLRNFSSSDNLNENLKSTNQTVKTINEGEEFFQIESHKYNQLDLSWNLSAHPAHESFDEAAYLSIRVSKVADPSVSIEQKIVNIGGHLLDEYHFNDLEQGTNYNVRLLLVVPNEPNGNISFEYEQTISTLKGFEFNLVVEDVMVDSAKIGWTYEVFDDTLVLNSLVLSGTGIVNCVLMADSNVFEADFLSMDSLTPSTTYDDWTIDINYDTDKKTTYQVDAFETLAISTPEIEITNIETLPSRDGIKISFFLRSNGHDITLLQIFTPEGPNDSITVSSFINNRINSVVIDGLVDGKTYNNWKILVYVGDGDNIEINIPTFTVGVDIIPITPPSIASKSIQLIENNTAKISWEVIDVDATIIDMKVIGTDITLSLGNELNGSKMIDNLQFNTTYDDWKLIINYQNEFGTNKTIESDFASFTTNEKSDDRSDDNLWWILLIVALIILALIALILIIFIKKRNQETSIQKS